MTFRGRVKWSWGNKRTDIRSDIAKMTLYSSTCYSRPFRQAQAALRHPAPSIVKPLRRLFRALTPTSCVYPFQNSKSDPCRQCNRQATHAASSNKLLGRFYNSGNISRRDSAPQRSTKPTMSCSAECASTQSPTGTASRNTQNMLS